MYFTFEIANLMKMTIEDISEQGTRRVFIDMFSLLNVLKCNNNDCTFI